MLELSICIPTYNRSSLLEETIERCIYDVKKHALDDVIEILIGDNCSTDGTFQICEAFQNRHKFLRYIRNSENIGGERNVFNVISQSRGGFAWVLSDDDSFEEGLILDILRIIGTHNYSVIFLNYGFFSQPSSLRSEKLAVPSLVDCSGTGSTSFFQKTHFANSFISSNVLNRSDFIRNKSAIERFQSNPWIQVHAAKIILSERDWYYYSTPKLKMREVPVGDSRQRSYLQGHSHFYFNAHVSYIELLGQIGFNERSFRKKTLDIQFHQILIEKNTWHHLTGREDLGYWLKITKRLIHSRYFNDDISFWARDVPLMLSSRFCINLVNKFYVMKSLFGQKLRVRRRERGTF